MKKPKGLFKAVLPTFKILLFMQKKQLQFGLKMYNLVTLI